MNVFEARAVRQALELLRGGAAARAGIGVCRRRRRGHAGLRGLLGEARGLFGGEKLLALGFRGRLLGLGLFYAHGGLGLVGALIQHARATND